MKRVKIADTAIVRTSTGLRFLGFDDLEGKEATLQLLTLKEIIIIEPKRATATVVPFIPIKIENGFVKSRGILTFTEQAFDDRRVLPFGKLGATTREGEEDICFQLP